MPALPRPHRPESITLLPRQAVVAAETDVLVVGGGPAGLGAALGAAEAGAEVILVERYGFLGGNATAALVMPFMSFHTEHPHAQKLGARSLLPTDHGPGAPVIAGVLRHLIRRLADRGGAISPGPDTGYTTPFDPELLKQVACEMLDDAGVHYLLHALATDALRDGSRVTGVVFETKSGPLVIRAASVIDCSGDGDVAARAGAPFEIGREDGLVQPMSLLFRMAEFEHAAFERYAREHPHEWRGVHGLWDLIRRASAAGDLDLPREDVLFFATPHAREVSVNSTRVTRSIPVLGTDAWDLTWAEWESRRQMSQLTRFLTRYVPGFEQAYLVQSGTQVGVRESRRILGDYVITEQDVLTARRFDDVIARCAYPVDEHNPTGAGTLMKRLPPGEAYDIPLRALLPRDTDGLLTAGRCISGTHAAHSSYRIMPAAIATGQAAGVAAALAATRHTLPREVPASSVQSELRRQGADLHEPVG